MESDGNMEIIPARPLHRRTRLHRCTCQETPASMIKALILSSPFLDWNLPAAIRHIAIPIVCALGKIMPNVRLKAETRHQICRDIVYRARRRVELPQRVEAGYPPGPGHGMGACHSHRTTETSPKHNRCTRIAYAFIRFRKER